VEALRALAFGGAGRSTTLITRADPRQEPRDNQRQRLQRLRWKEICRRGHAQAGQQGVVRQEDLPKVLRLIMASSGIGGTEQNPNRLTLILGYDNTIVEAFWE
jgi:hypothetical protein